MARLTAVACRGLFRCSIPHGRAPAAHPAGQDGVKRERRVMSGDPRSGDYTICAAVALDAVFTVRRYGDTGLL